MITKPRSAPFRAVAEPDGFGHYHTGMRRLVSFLDVRPLAIGSVTRNMA
jgi:hypothetical protein